MPEIETTRLRLRYFTLEDLDDLFRLYSDPEVMRYLSPRTREQTQASLRKHIKQWQEHNSGIQSSGLSGIIRSRFYPLCVPMQPTSSSKPQTDPPLPPKLTLPTMYDLPSEDPEEPGLPDEFHDLQPQLLSRTLRLIDYTNDRIFTGKDLNLYYDVRHPLWHKRPDWFLVLDVPRLYEKTDLRSSYVVWQEGVNPFVVIELLSLGTQKEDLGDYAELEPMVGETTTDALSITSSESEQNNGQGVKETPPKKWDVYERILRVPYYAVFSRYTNRLRGFQLEGGHYQEQTIDSDNPRFWIPELKLGLGVWQGEFEGITRQWLRWYDSEGNWVLTDTEQEQTKRAKLTEKLRSLSPEELEALGINLQELE